MDAGLACGDPQAVTHGAHTLENSAVWLGARAVVKLAETVEKPGRVRELETPLAELSRNVGLMQAALDEFIERSR